ncbi:MAG: biotin/lipoyl-binding protein [Anaerolineales bacterium]|nr:biotin/lipoyl-binding protein [Anaerolineales bacterium]
MRYFATLEGTEYEVEIIDEHHICLGEVVREVDIVAVGSQPAYSLIIDGRSFEAYIYPNEKDWQVLMIGQQYQVTVEEEREKRLGRPHEGSVAESGEFQLKAPMPGLIIDVPVSEGLQVEKGQVLAVLESMKMQNELKAPRAGTVTRLRIKSGDSVEIKQTLLTLA